MNPLLERNIVTSFSKHFSDLCVANGLVFVSEDETRNTSSLPKWVELRIIGPDFRQLHGDTYMICMEVDLLVTCTPLASDIFAIHNITGLLAANCNNVPITVGGEVKFCMTLDREVAKNIRILSYGRQADIKTKRASVIAIYESEATISP